MEQIGSVIKAIETKYAGYKFRAADLPLAPQKRMSAKADLTDKRFGRLLVIECLGVTAAQVGYRWWGCVCDCGEKVAVRSRELLRGHTKSCGCLQKEIAARSAGANKLPYGHASRNELLASYKKSARDRGYEFALTDGHFFALVGSDCTYCGSPPDLIRKPNKGVNGEFVYSGIDRVDPLLGYVEGNVVPCCWICNRAKGTLTAEEFGAWIWRITNFWKNDQINRAYTAARSARF